MAITIDALANPDSCRPMPSSRRRHVDTSRRPGRWRRPLWLAIAAFVIAGSVASVLLSSPKKLGKIMIDNGAASADIPAGHQISVEIPFKQGLDRDYGNLRIFGPGHKAIPFFIAPESLPADGSLPDSARVWIRLPELGRSTLTLSYDGGAKTRLSDGRAVFDDFDDFGESPIGGRRWIKSAMVGDVVPQQRMLGSFLWTTPFKRGQALAATAHGMALIREHDPGPSALAMADINTGKLLYGPVDGPLHAYAMSYIPSKDYIITSAVSSAQDLTLWVFRAKDLSLVGRIPFDSESGDRSVQAAYAGGSTVLRIVRGGTALQEYMIDWGRMVATPGRVHALPGGRLSYGVGQGYTYRAADKSFYVLEDHSRGIGNAIRRFTIRADGSLAGTGMWRYLPTDPQGGANESEGINADARTGILYYGSLGRPAGHSSEGSRQPNYNLFQIAFSGGGGASLWAPPAPGASVGLTARAALTGPTRVIFGVGWAGSTASPDAVAASASFGITDLAQPSAANQVSFRSSPDLSASEIFVDRAAAGSLTHNSTISLTSTSRSVSAPGTYEIDWDGTSARFLVDGETLGDFHDAVPPLRDAMLLHPFILAGAAANAGTEIQVHYVARATMLPKGAQEPDVTVE